ncbi:RUS1 family protein C16orf58 homolog isoform X1 [Latimeria chalumnae]|nr:PREDICTED: RUS1 family protein C16orf58 homolog isoform X1 [Latimeria chalumnae]|eukprot:XP_014346852.1 PREDICTED: RUS1 family protein C16orf58 homolog isoform X1 [Latimeria chalumnae]
MPSWNSRTREYSEMAVCDTEANVLCTEHYGTRSTRRYVQEEDGRIIVWAEQGAQAFRSLWKIFTAVFLPQGFPESVSEDYLTYQLWDTVQAFASSITGTLATQAVLRGVGVGDSTATIVGATVTWILKDGTGMVGRILFAWLKGSKLDCDAKKWRLFADILNDVAIFMEIVAPAFPACFTLIICVSGVFKSIVGVAGGATRAALTAHQARRDNMADVSAKDGSQETLVNLAGLLVSLVLVPVVTDNIALTYVLYLLFTTLHLYANYRAVRGVVMETLNQTRLNILTNHFLREGRVLTPARANPEEPVLPGFQSQVVVSIGSPLKKLVNSVSDLKKASGKNRKKYLLGVRRAAGAVCVVLKRESRSVDMIQAGFHAEILGSLIRGGCSGCTVEPEAFRELEKRVKEAQDDRLWDVVVESHLLVDKLFPNFLNGLIEGGWETERNLLDSDEWRLSYDVEDKKRQ